MRSDVVDGQNVWMIERGSRASFLLEAAQPVGIIGKRSGQNFDRDFAVKTSIARAINFTHPARAERREYFVRAELRASRNRDRVSGVCFHLSPSPR